MRESMLPQVKHIITRDVKFDLISRSTISTRLKLDKISKLLTSILGQNRGYRSELVEAVYRCSKYLRIDLINVSFVPIL